MEEQEGGFNTIRPDKSTLQLLRPQSISKGTSKSLAAQSIRKRKERARTSMITAYSIMHERAGLRRRHCCNYCSKYFSYVLGTTIIINYLKSVYVGKLNGNFIGFIKKRIRITYSRIEDAFLRQIDISLIAEQKRTSNLLELAYNKPTIKYLYIR